MAGSKSKDANQNENIGYGDGVTKEQWLEIREWWLGDIVPDFGEWDAARIEEGAEYLRANRLAVSDLIRSKLQSDKRLAIIGLVQHPDADNLPIELIGYAGIDFIALEARSPNDLLRGFTEDREGLTTVDLGGGMLMDLPHEEAKRRYPEKYRDPDARTNAYDSVIAAAQNKGIDIIYAMKGETWKEMNELAADEIAGYMKKHPDARGIYFSSIYSALKWPGYKDGKELDEIGFIRPLAIDHILSTNPRNDTSVRMPAFSLEQIFPGQTYSVSQFIMPKGYGMEWKNLRSSVEASGIKERFALGDIDTTPFAIQRYLFKGAVELSSVPEDELWKYYGTIAQGFFGPVEVRWDKVLDGVIIYPSEKKLQPLPSPTEMMEAAGQHIEKILEGAMQ